MEWLLKMIGIKQKIEAAHQKKDEYTSSMEKIQRAARSSIKSNERILSITQSIAIATGGHKRGLKK